MSRANIEFVNIHGQPVDTTKRVRLEKRDRGAPTEYHKGYCVEGIPPGAREEAMEALARLRSMAESAGGKLPEPWNESAWIAKAKARRVRTKPYELCQAAEECKALAEKAGWLRVTIRALSKGNGSEA